MEPLHLLRADWTWSNWLILTVCGGLICGGIIRLVNWAKRERERANAAAAETASRNRAIVYAQLRGKWSDADILALIGEFDLNWLAFVLTSYNWRGLHSRFNIRILAKLLKGGYTDVLMELSRYVKDDEDFRNFPALLEELKRRRETVASTFDFCEYDRGDFSDFNARRLDELIRAIEKSGISPDDLDWPSRNKIL